MSFPLRFMTNSVFRIPVRNFIIRYCQTKRLICYYFRLSRHRVTSLTLRHRHRLKSVGDNTMTTKLRPYGTPCPRHIPCPLSNPHPISCATPSVRKNVKSTHPFRRSHRQTTPTTTATKTITKQNKTNEKPNAIVSYQNLHCRRHPFPATNSWKRARRVSFWAGQSRWRARGPRPSADSGAASLPRWSRNF